MIESVERVRAVQVLVPLLLIVLTAGCGGRDSGSIAGAVHVDGSSTVYPITL
jgi:ABC-type phosphate transport system substrate-binding protein